MATVYSMADDDQTSHIVQNVTLYKIGMFEKCICDFQAGIKMVWIGYDFELNICISACHNSPTAQVKSVQSCNQIMQMCGWLHA